MSNAGAVGLFTQWACVGAPTRGTCYNPESAGSQAPGPDVCTRRRRSDIPCQGGQYNLTVVSRHYVACELLTVRKSSYTQPSISHICAGVVPSSESHQLANPQRRISRGSDYMSCIVTPKPPSPHAPCMRALAPSYDSTVRVDEDTARPSLQTSNPFMKVMSVVK